MINFYPGPSKVYEKVPQYVNEAYHNNIVSINHRSEEFVEMSKQTIELLKVNLNIPENFTIFFVASATECWEIVAQSLIISKSIHYYNGAFGEKWFNYTNKLITNAEKRHFSIEEKLSVESTNADVICITQNETSNGTAVTNEIISQVSQSNEDALVAVDATSSMAGVALNFIAADVWFASIQKCFGLPAGMALLICSPKAINRAIVLDRNNHYNSLVFMIQKMKIFQTTYTPNVLAIYLLMKTLQDRDAIDVVHKLITNRFSNWMSFVDSLNGCTHLVKNVNVRSSTVLTITTEAHMVTSLKENAKIAGILIGNGYGEWESNTFRIANFPAITEVEIRKSQSFLLDVINK